MIRHLAALLFVFGVLAPALAEQPAEKPLDQPKIVKLAPSNSAKKTRALKYTLLPDPLDLKPGNAATYWRRAGRSATSVKHPYDPKEDAWQEMPLKNLPRKEISDYLGLYAQALRLADQAARCDRCDWETPLLTLQNMNDLGVMLDEVQTCRQIARLLDLRCRLQMNEGKFDEAIYTLQTGLALARNLGDADSLVQDLVGIAIAAIMFGRVEEMIQIPGSPNLFWSLTVLPSPFIDVRRTMQVELNTIYRSFPQLRDLERDAAKKPLNTKETEKLIDDFLVEWMKLEGKMASPWQGRAALAMIALKVYPDAKAYLAERGYTKEEIEALPTLQAVFVYYLGQNSEARDDILKWLSAPAWQARPKLDQIGREAHKAANSGNFNPIIGLMTPAINKVYEAYMRNELNVGRLRWPEALRLYAAAHDGKAPPKFADVGDLPLPINPFTGKGFDGFYHFNDGKGVLEVPAPKPLPESLGRRYEIGK